MPSAAPPDRLATPLATRLGIALPIVLPGMTRVSTPPLVAAVSEAGGLGILATASLGPEDVRRAIRETRERTARPFGVNVPLLVPGARENLEAAVAERVPVVNYGLGNGGWCVPLVHAYGGAVIATVATLRHALAAERQGCDAVLAVGHEAAGHGGEVGSLVLIPTLVDALSIPVVAAGGFADGRGLAAALVLGAQAAALGTRFATAAESPLHPNTKAAVIAAGGEDTLITDRLDGMPCRVLSAPGARHAAREGNGTLAAIVASRGLARERRVPWLALVAQVLLRGPARTLRLARAAGAAGAMQRALEAGDLEHGVAPAGQALALVRASRPAGELAREAAATARALLSGNGGEGPAGNELSGTNLEASPQLASGMGASQVR